MLTRRRSRGAFPFHLLAVLGLAGVVLIAACSGADVSPDGGGAGVDSAGQQGAGDAAGEARDASGDDATGVGGVASLNDRKIVRTATIELEVDDVQGAVREVQDIAGRSDGFVSESNVFVVSGSGEDEVRRSQNATVVVRVPADAFDAAMTELRAVADEVKSESARASEVTEEYTDLEARLRNLQATEAQYILFLEQAESIDDVLAVQDRLDGVRLEIEQVQGRINVLDGLTDLATITVELTPIGAAPGGGQNWAVNALETAWEVSQDALVVLGTALIAATVLLVWLAALGAIGGLAWRLFGRRAFALARRLYEF